MIPVAANAGRLGCTNEAVNLVVAAPKGTVELAPKKSHTYVLRVTMPMTGANACQGAKVQNRRQGARDALNPQTLTAPPAPSTWLHGRPAR